MAIEPLPRPPFEERLRSHKINGCNQLGDTGFDAVFCRLSEAHALLTAIAAATEAPDGFGNLNARIQYNALDGVQTLVALAHFAASEAFDER